MSSNKQLHTGTTLIELIIAIVVASVMLGGIMTAYSNVTGQSADPMISQQSVLAAKAIMEEILLKPYFDPANTSDPCPSPNAGGRTSFDNVCDYHGYTSDPIVDHQGNSIPELATYSVSVSVVPAAGANALGSIPSADALRVQVTVNNPLARPVTLTAWRACYESAC